MRKSAIKIFAAVLVFSMCLTVSAFAESGTVTGSDVNFRSGPGTNYSVIDCLDKGTSLTVEDRSDSSWYKVTYNGKTGFIFANYVSVTEETSAPTQVVSEGTPGYINAMYVRFRSGPSTGYSVLGSYNTGTQLTILGLNGEWTYVTINGTNGYVFSRYVSANGTSSQQTEETVVEQPQPTPQPTPEPTPEVSVTPTEQTNGHITGDYVRFRSGPGTGYSIIGTYNRNTSITITGTSGDWTQATVDGKSGYVFSQYVAEDKAEEAKTEPVNVTPAESTTGYIKGNTVRLRSGPSTSSNILGEYNYGQELTITGTSGDWTAVTVNGTSGYVYSDYVTREKTTASDEGSSEGQKIANYALQFVGYDYCWGGTSPDTGFDCSGLVYYVYQHFGYTLNRVACDQAKNGVHVDPADLQPGDVLCFYSSSDYIGHAGIYIGNGQFVHASTYSTGVIVSDLSSGSYSARGYEARRIVSQ